MSEPTKPTRIESPPMEVHEIKPLSVFEHGSLKRQCLTCELQGEIAELRAENKELRRDLEAQHALNEYLRGDQNELG